MIISGLNGLVLAGGRSSRMGRDKALLNYQGRPQVEICFDLLKEYCEDVFVSKRADQVLAGVREFPFLDDAVNNAGPLGGIFTAMQLYPNRAWLVVACDLPYMEKQTLEKLIHCRDPLKMATAFRSIHDQMPEPLCAIYESSIGRAVQEAMFSGHRCPRKVLINSDILLLDPLNKSWLENINTPQDYLSASTYFSQRRTGA